jgi:hypothetical protein
VILELARDAETSFEDRKFVAFRRVILVIAASESWLVLTREPYQSYFYLALSVLISACFLAGFFARFARVATALVGLCMGIQIAATFPENANHQYLVVLCSLLLTLPRTNAPAERVDALDGMRWILLLGFFWAGVQKVLYGYYFGGEFLAHRMATDPDFLLVFQFFAPAAEVERLLAQGLQYGAGPFRVDSWLFVVVSNLSWLAEIGLPLLLVYRPTRRLAVVGSMLFIFAIQSAAREVYFGGIMIGLILLFWPGDALRRSYPLFAAAYLWLWVVNVRRLIEMGFG